MQSQDLFDFTKKVYSTLPRELRDYVYESLWDMPITILSLYTKKDEYRKWYTRLGRHADGAHGRLQNAATSSPDLIPEGLIVLGHFFLPFSKNSLQTSSPYTPPLESSSSTDIQSSFPHLRFVDNMRGWRATYIPTTTTRIAWMRCYENSYTRITFSMMAHASLKAFL
jgi:hypothetical protein